MTTMNEVNRDKTKVPDYFFFVMFRLSLLLLNSMPVKLIHNRCTCKLIIKLRRAMYMYANEQLRRLRPGDYSTIFTEPSANNC